MAILFDWNELNTDPHRRTLKVRNDSRLVESLSIISLNICVRGLQTNIVHAGRIKVMLNNQIVSDIVNNALAEGTLKVRPDAVNRQGLKFYSSISNKWHSLFLIQNNKFSRES